MKIFWVDIPCTPIGEGENNEFTNVGTFKTKREALDFAIAQFGTDKRGNINLITEGDDGE